MWAQNCVLHTKDTRMTRDFLPWAFLELMFSREQRKHDMTATPRVEARPHRAWGCGVQPRDARGTIVSRPKRRGLCSFPFKLKLRCLIFSKCLPEAAQEKRSLLI